MVVPLPSIVLALLPPVRLSCALFVILSLALILSAAEIITPFSPLFVIVVAIIEVPFELSSSPVFAIVVALIEPLFVSVPLFVMVFLSVVVPIAPLFVRSPLLSTAPFKVVADDNVVVPLLFKSEVTLLLNSASAPLFTVIVS